MIGLPFKAGLDGLYKIRGGEAAPSNLAFENKAKFVAIH